MAGANATVTSPCPAAMKATSNGVFQGDNPLDFALPLAILQICIVVILTRVLAFLLRPLRQPRVIAEIIVSYSFFLFVYIIYNELLFVQFAFVLPFYLIIINTDS